MPSYKVFHNCYYPTFDVVYDGQYAIQGFATYVQAIDFITVMVAVMEPNTVDKS